MRRNTPWTPWLPVNVTQGGARQEQRVRYVCRAQLADPHELQLGKRKVETRFCPNDGTATCDTDCESCIILSPISNTLINQALMKQEISSLLPCCFFFLRFKTPENRLFIETLLWVIMCYYSRELLCFIPIYMTSSN